MDRSDERSILDRLFEHIMNALFIVFGVVFCLFIT